MLKDDRGQDSSRTIQDYKEQLARDEQQTKLLKTVEALAEKMENLEKNILPYCDPKSGMCFLTKSELKNHLAKIEEQNRKILDGSPDLTSFYNKMAKEKDGRGPKVISERMPTSLKLNLIKYWCGDDEECKLAIENDPDIKIRDLADEKAKRLLGGGAFPGS